MSAQFLPCAADTHLTRKGDFLNGTTAVVDSGVWEWEIGSGDTYTNIQGISAVGLFYATVPTSNPTYALGAFDTVNLVVGRYTTRADPASLRPGSRTALRRLRVRSRRLRSRGRCASVQPENAAYCTLGTQFYARWLAQYPDPHDLVDYYVTNRSSLSGWDIAAHIRAARLAGFDVYALGIAERILARRPDWEHVLYGGWDYTESSWGALLRALLELHAAGDLPPAMYTEALEIADLLIAAQAVDGSWGGGDFQATAYALLGLRADPWNFTLPWQQAIIEGVDFLHATVSAEPTCGWSYPPDPEYGETNSEIHRRAGGRALAAVRGRFRDRRYFGLELRSADSARRRGQPGRHPGPGVSTRGAALQLTRTDRFSASSSGRWRARTGCTPGTNRAAR